MSLEIWMVHIVFFSIVFLPVVLARFCFIYSFCQNYIFCANGQNCNVKYCTYEYVISSFLYEMKQCWSYSIYKLEKNWKGNVEFLWVASSKLLNFIISVHTFYNLMGQQHILIICWYFLYHNFYSSNREPNDFVTLMQIYNIQIISSLIFMLYNSGGKAGAGKGMWLCVRSK